MPGSRECHSLLTMVIKPQGGHVSSWCLVLRKPQMVAWKFTSGAPTPSLGEQPEGTRQAACAQLPSPLDSGLRWSSGFIPGPPKCTQQQKNPSASPRHIPAYALRLAIFRGGLFLSVFASEAEAQGCAPDSQERAAGPLEGLLPPSVQLQDRHQPQPHAGANVMATTALSPAWVLDSSREESLASQRSPGPQ